MVDPERKEWSTAFAKQSVSDFEIFNHLKNTKQCHQLHYLQMAMEKAAKAHLLAVGMEIKTATSKHSVIQSAIQSIMQWSFLTTPGDKKSSWMIAFRKFAAKMDGFHPAVDRGTNPTNCEYPWPGPQGDIKVPADHDFQIALASDPQVLCAIRAVRSRAIALCQ